MSRCYVQIFHHEPKNDATCLDAGQPVAPKPLGALLQQYLQEVGKIISFRRLIQYLHLNHPFNQLPGILWYTLVTCFRPRLIRLHQIMLQDK